MDDLIIMCIEKIRLGRMKTYEEGGLTLGTSQLAPADNYY